MKTRKMAILAGLVAAAAVSGSGAQPAPTPAHRAPSGTNVIDLEGMRNISFGTSQRELTRRGMLRAEPEACGPRLAGLPTADPVFADDRLVLLWADPSTSTPEGIAVGTPVSRVRAAYPAATRLTAPAGSYRFDGILMREGDRAYLFLHDGKTVRKTIAGYAEYAQRLFDDGFGTC